MTSNLNSPSLCEICEQVKQLGYGTSGRIRLYGEEFEVVSDPFPDQDGIAVHVKSVRIGANVNSPVRVLQLPATIVESVKGRIGKAA
jgi:hypothetical protein